VCAIARPELRNLNTILDRATLGHRVKVFYLMRDIYLDQLAMADGEGCKLLQTIKCEAMREYRRKNGWHDRRP
jgi:hypothetical protein